MGSNVYPTPTASSGGTPRAANEFTSSGTYTVPTGATWARIIAIGGGGSGGGPNGSSRPAGGGGSGTYIDKWVAVTAGANHTVTIGAGGTGVSTNANGNAGGTTSVGTLVSADGGGGGRIAATTNPSPAGGGGQNPGFPGLLTFDQTGAIATWYGGNGGGGFLGTGAVQGGDVASQGGFGGKGYGAGGAGVGNTGQTSGAGAAGYVIIYSY